MSITVWLPGQTARLHLQAGAGHSQASNILMGFPPGTFPGGAIQQAPQPQPQATAGRMRLQSSGCAIPGQPPPRSLVGSATAAAEEMRWVRGERDEQSAELYTEELIGSQIEG